MEMENDMVLFIALSDDLRHFSDIALSKSMAEEYDPTVEDTWRKYLPNVSKTVEIIGVSQDFDDLHTYLWRKWGNAHGFIAILTDGSLVLMIERLKQLLSMCKGHDVPICLCGPSAVIQRVVEVLPPFQHIDTKEQPVEALTYHIFKGKTQKKWFRRKTREVPNLFSSFTTKVQQTIAFWENNDNTLIPADALLHSELLDDKRVHHLIDQLDPNEATKYLINACVKGNVKIVKWLLDVGADVNVRGSEYDTLVIQGFPPRRMRPVRKHKIVLARGMTPLAVACITANTNLVRLLLPNSPLNMRSGDWGYTPLDWTLYVLRVPFHRGNPEAVLELLLGARADPMLMATSLEHPLLDAHRIRVRKLVVLCARHCPSDPSLPPILHQLIAHERLE